MASERVAIVGSREFQDLDSVRRYVRRLSSRTIVISGGARGVDQVAENSAIVCGLKTEVYKAEWDKHGHAAGFLRNSTIVAVADRVVAFWDGKSNGTRDTIEKAKARGIPVEVIRGK